MKALLLSTTNKFIFLTYYEKLGHLAIKAGDLNLGIRITLRWHEPFLGILLVYYLLQIYLELVKQWL